MMPSSQSGVPWVRKQECMMKGEEDSSENKTWEGSKQPRRSIELECHLDRRVNWIGKSIGRRVNWIRSVESIEVLNWSGRLDEPGAQLNRTVKWV
jgi:hypothetical protein